jgi:hypothetical protein
MDVTEEKIVPLRQLNVVQRALAKIFRIDKWLYGRRGPARLGGKGESEQLRREQMSLLMGEFTAYTQLSNDRHVKYADYDAMDEGSPEVGAVLSLYAQEATPEDLKQRKVVWITAKDREIERKLTRVIDELDLEERAWGTVRNLSKYGDCFQLSLFSEGEKMSGHAEGKLYLRSLQYIYPGRVKRIEADTLLGYVSEDLATILPPEDDEHNMYAPWDFTHGRLMAYDQESIYGRSMCEEVRKIWKMLQILETMVALAHVQRAIDRNIYYIDVGNASEEEALGLVKKYKQWLRRKEFFDPTTQQFKNDFNPVTIQEDIFWPTRANSNSRVDTMQGKIPPQGLVDDLNYFRNKLCAGLGVPREYLDGIQQGSVFDSKAALVMQDIHFARKMERLQRGFRKMLHRICQVHLALDGIVTNEFRVNMAPLSLISDRLNEDLLQRRSEVAGAMTAVADVMGWPKDTWNEYITKMLYKDLPAEVLEKLVQGIRKMVSPEPFSLGPPGKNGDKDDPTKHDPNNPVSPDAPQKMPHDELPLTTKTLFKDVLGKEATDELEEFMYQKTFGEERTLRKLHAQLKEMKREILDDQKYSQIAELAKAAVKEVEETNKAEESVES